MNLNCLLWNWQTCLFVQFIFAQTFIHLRTLSVFSMSTWCLTISLALRFLPPLKWSKILRVFRKAVDGKIGWICFLIYIKQIYNTTNERNNIINSCSCQLWMYKVFYYLEDFLFCIMVQYCFLNYVKSAKKLNEYKRTQKEEIIGCIEREE